MNSTDKAYERDMFLLTFTDSCCPESTATVEDYNESIFEYKALLDDAIIRGNKDEIKQLRREIQQAKAEKRKFIRENKIEREIAYT